MTDSFDLDVAILASGGHHKGAAVLINSLIANGFRGRIWIGYRGDLPPWTAKLEKVGAQNFRIGADVLCCFRPVSDEGHITFQKPALLRQILSGEGAPAAAVYLDADIVVTGPWRQFQNWARLGVMVVQDSNEANMPSEHPRKRAWKNLAQSRGWTWRERSGYVNGGLLGLARNHLDFLQVWEDVTAAAQACSLAGHEMKDSKGSRADPFHIPDQDALNMALHLTDYPIAMETPAAMGFSEPGNNLMLHAVFNPKPWDRVYGLKTILKGLPPTPADHAFWRYAEGPIKVFSDAELRAKRRRVIWAARAGRIICSPDHYGFG